MAQIKVANTREISNAANKLFFKPNCIGVNIRLKNMFNIKGKATIKDISF